jgi:hypothetical protein
VGGAKGATTRLPQPSPGVWHGERRKSGGTGGESRVTGDGPAATSAGLKRSAAGPTIGRASVAATAGAFSAVATRGVENVPSTPPSTTAIAMRLILVLQLKLMVSSSDLFGLI